MANQSAIRASRAFVELFADSTKLQQGLREAENRLKEFASRTTTLGRTMSAASGVLLSPFALSTKVFADFDDNMRETQAVTQATAKQLVELSEVAKQLGRDTSFTAIQVSEAMTQLGRAGFSVNEIKGTIKNVLDLSRSTRTELSDTAQILASSMRSFRMSSKETARIADVLSTAANASALSLTDLGESFKYVAPIAHEAGMSIEDTAAVVSMLANFGIKGTQAGTAMKNILMSFSSIDLSGKFEELGVQVKDANGNLRSFASIMIDVGNATKNLGSQERLGILKDLFNLRALAGGASLSKGADQIFGMIDLLETSQGKAAEVSAKMDAGIGGSFRLMLSALESVKISLTEAINNQLTDYSDKLRETLASFSIWVNEHNDAIITYAKLSAELLGLSVAIWGAGKAIKAFSIVAQLFRGSLKGIQGGIGLLTKAFYEYSGVAQLVFEAEEKRLDVERANIALREKSAEVSKARRLLEASELSVVKSIGYGKEQYYKALEYRLAIINKLKLAEKEYGVARNQVSKAILESQWADQKTNGGGAWAVLVGTLERWKNAAIACTKVPLGLTLEEFGKNVVTFKYASGWIDKFNGSVKSALSSISGLSSSLKSNSLKAFSPLLAVFDRVKKGIYSEIDALKQFEKELYKHCKKDVIRNMFTKDQLNEIRTKLTREQQLMYKRFVQFAASITTVLANIALPPLLPLLYFIENWRDTLEFTTDEFGKLNYSRWVSPEERLLKNIKVKAISASKWTLDAFKSVYVAASKATLSVVRYIANINFLGIAYKTAGIGAITFVASFRLLRNALSVAIGLVKKFSGAVVTIGLFALASMAVNATKAVVHMSKEEEKATERLSGLHQRQKAQIESLEKIAELSKVKPLDENVYKTGEKIVSDLTSAYGDFGATVDKTTKSITLSEDALDKLNEKQRQQMINQKMRELNEAKTNYEAQSARSKLLTSAKEGTGLTYLGYLSTNLRKTIGFVSDVFSGDKIGTNFSDQVRESVNATLELSDKIKQIENDIAELNDGIDTTEEGLSSINDILTENQKTFVDDVVDKLKEADSIMDSISGKIQKSKSEELAGIVAERDKAFGYYESVLKENQGLIDSIRSTLNEEQQSYIDNILTPVAYSSSKQDFANMQDEINNRIIGLRDSGLSNEIKEGIVDALRAANSLLEPMFNINSANNGLSKLKTDFDIVSKAYLNDNNPAQGVAEFVESVDGEINGIRESAEELKKAVREQANMANIAGQKIDGKAPFVWMTDQIEKIDSATNEKIKGVEHQRQTEAMSNLKEQLKSAGLTEFQAAKGLEGKFVRSYEPNLQYAEHLLKTGAIDQDMFDQFKYNELMKSRDYLLNNEIGYYTTRQNNARTAMNVARDNFANEQTIENASKLEEATKKFNDATKDLTDAQNKVWEYEEGMYEIDAKRLENMDYGNEYNRITQSSRGTFSAFEGGNIGVDPMEQKIQENTKNTVDYLKDIYNYVRDEMTITAVYA